MARNSRFSTTSGPSSNRKPFKKKSKDKDDSPDRRNSFSDRKTPPKPFDERKKPFQKRDNPGKDSRSSRPSSNEKKEFSERRPRSFSRDQSNDLAKGDNRAHGKDDFGKKRFEGEKSDERKPRQRKSFVESRLDKAKRAQPAAIDNEATPKDELIRLNKFISNSGVCSRREADNLIAMGLITVNGKSVTEMGYKVKPTDDVRHDGKRLKAEKPVYILLNKPKGFITTTDDPQERNTVMQLINGACKERVYPVGRLDRNTSGLLLLTNDGDLTEKLSHPSHNVKKIYKAELDRPLTKADFQKIMDGVRLEEGKAIIDDLAIVSDDGKTVGLEIHIGWNRIVRRIFESLDYQVVKLDRSVYATLDKKDLPRGHWRFLRQDEVIRLKHFQ